ncbi:hypothetical protein CC78DRAFT_469893 [Lojkania enalia]|uniref:Uncharacterized protein n=1 Tax=Lojkania enalia TaxID=147567 RepID=A0A9P4K5E2_9PLEO|nr:hypothetical protein CC78DRAFT_469893 [Didymosphaeria enalia]
MRIILGLLCTVTQLWTVNANVEKTIFLGPSPLHLPNVHPSLDDLRLHSLSPTASPILETRLLVQFPSASAPRGLDFWYLLRGLEAGRRYEVRICWPATQPTKFWLSAYPINLVFDTPELISSLAAYSKQRQGVTLGESLKGDPHPTTQSVLFLRIQAAASFYSANRTLMEYPPAVDVDIILDPFLFNVLPRSLAPTAAYISAVTVFAWFLSGHVYRWLLFVASEPTPKPHIA